MRVGWIILLLIGSSGIISGQTSTLHTEIWSFPEIIDKTFEIQESLPDQIHTLVLQGFFKPDGKNKIPPAALIKRSGLEIQDNKTYTFILESYAGKIPFEGITTLFSAEAHSNGTWRKQVASVEFTDTKTQYEINQYSCATPFGKTQSFLMWKMKDENIYKLYHFAPNPESSHWKIIQQGRIITIAHNSIISVSSSEIEVLDLSGNKVSTVKVTPESVETRIPTGTLPVGIYIIRFSVNEEFETRRVFIPGA